MPKQYKFFADDAAVLSYISSELLDTLRDDLYDMEHDGRRHYTDKDRADMKAKIADIRTYCDR